jgi:hypothetical protein
MHIQSSVPFRRVALSLGAAALAGLGAIIALIAINVSPAFADDYTSGWIYPSKGGPSTRVSAYTDSTGHISGWATPFQAEGVGSGRLSADVDSDGYTSGWIYPVDGGIASRISGNTDSAGQMSGRVIGGAYDGRISISTERPTSDLVPLSPNGPTVIGNGLTPLSPNSPTVIGDGLTPLSPTSPTLVNR